MDYSDFPHQVCHGRHRLCSGPERWREDAGRIAPDGSGVLALGGMDGRILHGVRRYPLRQFGAAAAMVPGLIMEGLFNGIIAILAGMALSRVRLS